ncbi:AraC family transcriptional regulator N-terminal domain-containing protein [Hydrocarboniphaga effusa]|uniref:AraC family transcriptional regulator n=1 Tax=Hydrocarboniphaga effusa TaxID=243629 RepID=UPI00398BDEC0
MNADLEQRAQAFADAIGRAMPDDGLAQTAIPGLWLIRSSQPTEPLQVLHEPAVCIIAQGAKQVMLADRSYAYDPAKYLVVSVDLPLSGHVTQASEQVPYLCMRLDLDPVLLASVMMERGLDRARETGIGRGLLLSATEPELIDASTRLVRLLQAPGDIGFLAPLVVREIYYRLMLGEQGESIRRIAVAESRTQRISRSIVWIKTHYSQPFSVETLARQAGMSPSAFHQSFKAVTSMSPLQFQKQLRLQEARRLMIGKAIDAASAGFEVGYESASQFTREYRRLFGQPPARDVARFRERDAGALPIAANSML